MNNELQILHFENQEVRIITRDGQPWWVAADVCRVLSHTDPSKAVARLDPDEKGTNSIRTPSGHQEVLIINEPGLYSLILTSRKPEAKRFKRWITHEVLPSIRNKGSYSLPGSAAALDPKLIESIVSGVLQQMMPQLVASVHQLLLPQLTQLLEHSARPKLIGRGERLVTIRQRLLDRHLQASKSERGRMRDKFKAVYVRLYDEYPPHDGPDENSPVACEWERREILDQVIDQVISARGRTNRTRPLFGEQKKSGDQKQNG